jgi:hypothetical protein
MLCLYPTENCPCRWRACSMQVAEVCCGISMHYSVHMVLSAATGGEPAGAGAQCYGANFLQLRAGGQQGATLLIAGDIPESRLSSRCAYMPMKACG